MLMLNFIFNMPREYEQHMLDMGDSVQLTPEESTQKNDWETHKGIIYGMVSERCTKTPIRFGLSR